MNIINTKQEIISKALEIEDLDNISLAKIAGFNEDELDFIKIFWEPAFNKSWIYLTKDMVVNWLGYKDNKDTMTHFYNRNLLKNYEENIDYKEVKKDDEIVKKSYSPNLANRNKFTELEITGNRAKFYIVTGECLKCLLMTAQTDKGKIVRKIYIKTENLVNLMFEVLQEKQLHIKTLELQQKDKLFQEKEEELSKTLEILEKERDDVYWQKILSQNNLSLIPYHNKKLNLYTGAYEKQHSNEIYTNKMGIKTTNARQTAFNTSSNPNNPFIFDLFEIYQSLEKPTESYIHALLEPLNIKKIEGNRRLGSKEQFMISRKWLNYFVQKASSYTNELAEEVNEVINIIEKNNRNFDKANKEIEDLFETETLEESEKKNEPIKEILEEVKEIKQIQLKQQEIQIKQKEEIIQEIKQTKEEIKKEIKKYINEEHKKLEEQLEALKTTFIPDINIPDQSSYVCKIKQSNVHKAPESYFSKSSTGRINHYCKDCRERRMQIEDLEKNIKEITHKLCKKCDTKRPIEDFLFKTNTERYLSCSTCIERYNRNLDKKDKKLKEFCEIQMQELSQEDKQKLEYLINELQSIPKQDLKNKKQINQIGNYKRCNLSLTHASDELKLWILKEHFTTKDFRCKPCKIQQNKKL